MKRVLDTDTPGILRNPSFSIDGDILIINIDNGVSFKVLHVAGISIDMDPNSFTKCSLQLIGTLLSSPVSEKEVQRVKSSRGLNPIE